ncbi:MAG: YmfQ family protein [Oscillospiraceae bacterium]|nr:YmfQ family protein [Oscillospiraceae bacterium]
MDRRILDYLPVVLREVPEFKALMQAEQPELEDLWAAQDSTLENQFVPTAEDYGVRRWEKMLGIRPKGTDGLEVRRTRVLSMLGLKLPYTLRWLKNWLAELMGAGNFGVDVVDYLIGLTLRYTPDDERPTDDIIGVLTDVKPANMLLHVTAVTESPAAAAPVVIVAGAMSVMETTLPSIPEVPRRAYAVNADTGALAELYTRDERGINRAYIAGGMNA